VTANVEAQNVANRRSGGPFQWWGLCEETRAEFVRQQVEAHDEEMRKQVVAQFEDRYFYVIDENGDAEVTAEKATLEEVEILELREGEAVVHVSYDVKYEADLSHDDPDMQSYDHETGTTMSWGPRPHVTGRRKARGGR